MVARYVNELAEGTHVDSSFVLKAKELRSARNGERYLAVELADRTGVIPGVAFRPSRVALDAPAGTVVRVRGTVTTFRGLRRITIDGLTPAETWSGEDFIAQGARSRDELVAEFTAVVRSVKHRELRSLLRSVFGDKEVLDRFSVCPGAQSYHHAYLGGLIEHTVSVATLCASSAERYAGVDTDLLITAALLHDIGKIDELAFDTTITYTDEGRLIGHVVLGVQRVARAGERVGMGTALLSRLEHAILSHHGELEWGSPKRPSTIEALLLHHADNLDAKASGFAEILAGASHAEESWTDSSNLFRRPLHAPRPAEDDRPVRPDEDADHFLRSA